MYNPAQEISSINFGAIIGGSLNAVVEAQRESANTTVEFVKQVGFMPGEKDETTGEIKGVGAPVCVSFSYNKEVPSENGQDATEVRKMQLDVPILTMMPIPFIKIEYADISFNVKINSVNTSSTSDKSESKVDNTSHVNYKGFGLDAGTTLNASFSNQKSTASNEEVKKDYSLNISIHAVQDDIPAGMSRILDILEDSIATKDVTPKKQ